METRQRPATPPWARKYSQSIGWSREELRNLLCGFAPNPFDDTPEEVAVLPPRDASDRLIREKQVNDRFIRDELRRKNADRHVRDAVTVGDLKLLEPPMETIVKKVQDHLTEDEIEALRRAIAHERSCSESYRVASKEAIRWAASQRDLFPHFPFTVEDQSESNVLSSGVVSTELKEHRQLLFRRARKTLGFTTQAAFRLKHKEFTPDILRGIVNSDSDRVDVAKWTPRFLKLLSIEEKDWNPA